MIRKRKQHKDANFAKQRKAKQNPDVYIFFFFSELAFMKQESFQLFVNMKRTSS